MCIKNKSEEKRGSNECKDSLESEVDSVSDGDDDNDDDDFVPSKLINPALLASSQSPQFEVNRFLHPQLVPYLNEWIRPPAPGRTKKHRYIK
jgi:hypothetical protein